MSDGTSDREERWVYAGAKRRRYFGEWITLYIAVPESMALAYDWPIKEICGKPKRQQMVKQMKQRKHKVY